MIRSLLAVIVFLATAGPAVAGNADIQTLSSDPQTRCQQLLEFWVRHGGNKSEGGGGWDMPRKSAEVDCAAGRHGSGVRTMEELLRRNGYTIPPA
ncbi:MAG: hypothetical protein ACT4O6_00120 [Reyranella sp.]